MRQVKISNQSGFSLVEMMIAIMIAGILFLVVTNLYIINQNSYRTTDTRAELIQNGRVIMDRLIREVRQSPDLVTILPETNSDHGAIPTEIMFEDGHENPKITYIRYYLNTTGAISTVNRQEIEYYFNNDPNINVHWFDVDQLGNSPQSRFSNDNIIGEYVTDIEFWGDKLINIDLYLEKNNQSKIISTSVYGRNL